MKLSRIAHAGWVVSHGDTHCLIDPLLKNDFGGGCQLLNPSVRVDFQKFRIKKWDAVVLTHSHPDHFSLETLNLIGRDTPIYFPDGDWVLERCLKDLGFFLVRPVRSRGSFSAGRIRFTATPSDVPFSEMGVLIQAGNQSCWNVADSIISAATIQFVKKKLRRRLDIVLFPFQPLIESPLGIEVIGNDFPSKAYEDLLKKAAMIGARYLIPSACGFQSSIDWVNSKMFPVTEARFARDLAQSGSQIQVLHLKSGDELEMGRKPILIPGKLDFVRQGRSSAKKWDPKVPTGPLGDPNFPKYPLSFLRKRVLKFISEDFPERLDHKRFSKCVWQLEIIFPEGKKLRLFSNLSRKISWKKGRSRDAQMVTTAAASAILGVLLGDLDQGGVMHTGLIRHKFQGEYREEPLTSVIYRMSHERCLMRRLQKILKPESVKIE